MPRKKLSEQARGADNMRHNEAGLRQIIREMLKYDAQVSLDAVRSAVTGYVLKDVPIPITVRDALRAVLRGEAAVDVGPDGGPISQSFYKNVLPPVSQGYDDFVYRGLIIRTEQLPLLGIDPSSLPTDRWIDLTKGEHLGGATEEESGLDDEGAEGTGRGLPLIPIPNPPDKTVSSWTYDREVAEIFAQQGGFSVGASVILRAPIGRPNSNKFLPLDDLYRLFGMKHTGEREVLGIAGDQQPIMACAVSVMLP